MAKYPSIRIVIVDDEKTCRDIIKSHVELSGFFENHNIFIFDDPFKALEFISENKVEILITDYKMPGMQGNDLCEAVKEYQPEVKIILFSASKIPSFPQIREDVENLVDVVLEKVPDEKPFINELEKLLIKQ